MSNTAFIIVIFGLSIIASRGPLVVAPGKTRDLYMRLFDTDGHMRALGVVFAVLSGLIVWALWGVSETPAQIITYLAEFIFLLAIIAMIMMPKPFRLLATRIWGAFSEGAMRVLGFLAVLFGAWMVYFGLGL